MNVTEVMEGARRFADTYYTLVGDHLRAHRHNLLVIIGLSAVGAAAQGGMIGFIIFVINYFQEPGAVAGGTLAPVLGNRAVALTVFAAILAGLLILGARALYVAMVRTRALGRGFHRAAAQRCLEILARSTSLTNPGMPRDGAVMRRLVIRDSIQLGNAVESIVGLLEPAFRAVVALGLMAWISTALTLSIMPLLLVLLPVAHRITTSVQRVANHFYMDVVGSMYGRIGTLITTLSARDTALDEAARAAPEAVYERAPEVRTYFDEYDKIKLAQARSQYAIAVGSTAFVVVAVVSASYFASGGYLSWGSALGYLMAMMQLFSAGRLLQSQLTALSVFYPAARRHLAFYANDPARRDAAGPGPRRPAYITVRSAGVLPEGEPECVLRPGSVSCLITDRYVDRVTLEPVLAPLIECSSEARSFWARSTCFLSARAQPAGEALGIGHGVEAAALRGDDARFERFLDAIDLETSLARVVAETGQGAVPWEALTPALRLAVLARAVVDDARPVVLIDARLLQPLAGDAREALYECLAERYLLVFANWLPRGLRADRVIVVREDKVEGIGTLAWAEAMRERLRRGTRGASAAVDEDAELLDV